MARRWWWLAALPVVLLAIILGLLAWAMLAESGVAWGIATLERVSGGQVRIEGVHGRLLGPLRLEQVTIESGGDRYILRDVELDWKPRALLDRRLDVQRLKAARLELLLADSGPAVVPADLRLPLTGRIDALEIGEIVLSDAAQPLARQLTATISSDGATHRIEALSVLLDAGALTGQGSLAAAAPFDLSAEARLVGVGEPALTLATRAAGTLEAITLDVDGEGKATAKVEGFAVAGRASLRPFAAQPLAALRLTARGLDPRLFLASAPRARLTLDVDLAPQADGALAGRLLADNAAAAPLDRGGLPFSRVETSLVLHWDVEPRRLRLDGLAIKVGAGGTATGAVDLLWADAAPWPQGSADLVVARLDPSALHSALRPARLAGRILMSGDGMAQKASLMLADGARRLAAELARRGDTLTLSRLSLTQGAAELAGSGELRLDAARAWRFAGKLRHFDPSAFVAVPPADLNAEFDASGRLAPQLDGRLHFTLGASRLAGQALAGEADLTFAGLDQPTNLLAINGKAHLRGLLDLRLGDSRLHLDGGWGGVAEKLELSLKVPDLARHRPLLAQLAPQLPANLAGSLDLSFAGTPAQHRLAIEARTITPLSPRGRGAGGEGAPTAQASTTTPSPQPALRTWDSASRQASPARGEGALPQSPTGKYLSGIRLTATGALRSASADWRDATWQGTLDTLSISGDLPLSLLTPTRLSASRKHVALGAADLSFAGGRIAIAEADWQRNRWNTRGRFDGISLRLDGAEDKSIPPTARASGDWSLAGREDQTLAGRLRASVPDLRGLGPAIDGNLTSAGALEIDATLAGTFAAPLVTGYVRGSGLTLGLIDQNVQLRDGELAIRFDKERALVERLTFVAPHQPPPAALRIIGTDGFPNPQEPGRLNVSGEIDLRKRQARLVATLKRLPLMQRAETWVVASGTVNLDSTDAGLRLGAQLVADAGYVAAAVTSQPKLAGDIVVLGREAVARRGPRIETDIAFDVGQHFHLRTAGLAARLDGRLRVRGSGQGPLIATGSIATRDATYEAYGQNLVVERGIVNFQGPLDNPGLNVLALRTGLAVEAGVAVTGTAQRPQVRLVSTPAVSEAEKLSWIVLGRAPDVGGTDASLLLAAAGAILGGQGDGVTAKLAQALGVDELSLRQAEGGDPLTGQILVLGKRLSARTHIAYEQGLTAATGAIKLTHALTPRISVVTRAGEDSAIDVFYHFAFD